MAGTTTLQSTYINAGKFASVSSISNSNLALKTVHSDSHLHREELIKEFWIGVDIHHILDTPTSPFYCPKYHTFFSPASSQQDSTDTKTESTRLADDVRAFVFNQERSTISLDLIPPLSRNVGEAYRKITKSDCKDIRLIRLYLGRVPGSSARALQKASDTDPPIDLDQYRMLRKELMGNVDMPEAEKVCWAMGLMLGRVHWGAGVNGRDSELCLAGDGKGGVRLVIFDWNMCQRWIIRHPLQSGLEPSQLPFGEYANDPLTKGARRLATLIANCESYYPRPRQRDVYPSFKHGYEKGVEQLLAEYTPSSGSLSGVIDKYAGICNGYTEGVEAFFEEYEKLDREKLERWARRAQGANAIL